MEHLLAYAKEAAEKASVAILSHYGTDVYELKDDQSPITLADRAAHEIIFESLSKTGIPILSEEGTMAILPYPERLWIVDPLDGTKGFINQTDDFSVMIGLIEHGRPVLGVVLEPVHKRTYTALKGMGAHVETPHGTTRLIVSTRTAPNLRGVVSVNHFAPYMRAVCDTLSVTETIAVGSVGIKASYIGSDRADFYTNIAALGEWDVCAPEIILTEAGGMVTDIHGSPLAYGTKNNRIAHGVVFSNGICHSSVLDALHHFEAQNRTLPL